MRSLCQPYLRSITSEGSEFGFVRSNVLIPSGGMGIFRGIGGRLEGLKGGYVGLGGRVSAFLSASPYASTNMCISLYKKKSEVH